MSVGIKDPVTRICAMITVALAVFGLGFGISKSYGAADAVLNRAVYDISSCQAKSEKQDKEISDVKADIKAILEILKRIEERLKS